MELETTRSVDDDLFSRADDFNDLVLADLGSMEVLLGAVFGSLTLPVRARDAFVGVRRLLEKPKP